MQALAVALAVTAVLAALPPSWLMPAQGWALGALRPGQRAAAGMVALGRQVKARVASHFGNVAELAAARDVAERLAAENRVLAERLASVQRRLATTQAERPAADRALLRLGGIEARVLGQQARGYLLRQKLLDVGRVDGVEPGALVLHGAAVVDRGEQHGVEPGHLAVEGGRVWGRVVRAGPNTAVVRTLDAPGFRDVVRLRSPRGAEGIVEGTGEMLCRIRMIAVTEPVTPGDEVLAGSLAGLGAPLPRYGVVERVEQSVGAAHWDIWMRPALTGSPPEKVVVVRVEP